MKKERHLQISGCSWNTIPVMCYVAFATVVFVGKAAIQASKSVMHPYYRTCTATQMIAICKMNGRKNKAIGWGDFSIYAATQY